MSGIVAQALVFVPLIVFSFGMLYTTGTLVALEPYQRIVVGATIDTGSRIVSLLGPTAIYLLAIFGIVGVVLYLAFVGLRAAISQNPKVEKILEA